MRLEPFIGDFAQPVVCVAQESANQLAGLSENFRQRVGKYIVS